MKRFLITYGIYLFFTLLIATYTGLNASGWGMLVFWGYILLGSASYFGVLLPYLFLFRKEHVSTKISVILAIFTGVLYPVIAASTAFVLKDSMSGPRHVMDTYFAPLYIALSTLLPGIFIAYLSKKSLPYLEKSLLTKPLN